jgi:hydroxymethylpyrimidine pyrophosphatase-like HAD family hydrolase
MDVRPKTVFCDIDGTLLCHMGNLSDIIVYDKDSEPTKGAAAKLNEWDYKGYKIILVTGRPEPMRKLTMQQLQRAGIVYHQLIMDVGGGCRVLINDTKPTTNETAVAITVKRDKGISDIEI